MKQLILCLSAMLFGTMTAGCGDSGDDEVDTATSENDAASCGDNVDNDADGKTDCDDADCDAICSDGGEDSSEDTESESASTGGDVSGMPIPPGDDNAVRPDGDAGNLKVLDWAGFTSAVSYSFDDGNKSQIDNWDAMMALDVNFTFYLVTDWNDENAQIWKDAIEAGHEIGNHTKNHSCDADAVEAANTALEEALGTKIYTLAAPEGNGACKDTAKPYHFINRMVNGGIIKPNDTKDPFLLPSYIPLEGADLDALGTPAENARNQGGWVVYCIHGFTGDSAAYHPIDFDVFTSGVEAMKSYGDVWIDSVMNVGAYWVGQKTFAAVTPTEDGDNTVWEWTLPDNFPSGKYLRVTVDGGTLTQGGTPLVWSGHGYYEVSLDEGELTLTP